MFFFFFCKIFSDLGEDGGFIVKTCECWKVRAKGKNKNRLKIGKNPCNAPILGNKNRRSGCCKIQRITPRGNDEIKNSPKDPCENPPIFRSTFYI